jgi:hypothetical protein
MKEILIFSHIGGAAEGTDCRARVFLRPVVFAFPQHFRILISLILVMHHARLSVLFSSAVAFAWFNEAHNSVLILF